MKALLLGGHGRLARHLVAALESRGWEVEAPGREEVDASVSWQVQQAALCGLDGVRWGKARRAAMERLQRGYVQGRPVRLLHADGSRVSLVEAELRIEAEADDIANEAHPVDPATPRADVVVCCAGFTDAAAMERGEGRYLNEEIAAAGSAACYVADVPFVYLSSGYADAGAYGESRRQAEEEARDCPTTTIVRAPGVAAGQLAAWLDRGRWRDGGVVTLAAADPA